MFGTGERLREDDLSPARGNPRKGPYRLALGLTLGFLIVAGAVGVQAFTLIYNVYEDPVSPQQGTATSTFVVEGGVAYATCPQPIPQWSAEFYFDKAAGGPQIWKTTIYDCAGGKQDTGRSQPIPSPPGFAASGKHTIEIDVVTQTGALVGKQTQPYTINGPALKVDPTCGSPGLPVTLTGTVFQPNTIVTITFTPPAGATPIATAVPDQSGTFVTGALVPNVPAGNYVFVATQQVIGALGGIQTTARAPFLVPCVAAKIVLKPMVGPPGTVVTVIGTGFPIGAVVKLSWNQGITVSLPSITIGATGGFRVVVLIFPHDELGQRVMSASPDLTVPSAPLFNIATAKVLVVPGSEQPRDFSWRH